MKYTLKDICTKIGSGATPTGGKEAYKGGDYALVRSQNVLDYTFTTSGLAYINETQAKKLDGVKVEVGDILLNITGDSVARACIIPDEILPARVNQHVAIIRANNQYALNEYLLYFLQYNKQYLLSISQGGGTRSAITKKMIEDIEIDLPSLEDQLSIVNIINSISKKIEINQQINDNLEQQAQVAFNNIVAQYSECETINLSEIAILNPKRTIVKGTFARSIEMAQLSTSGSFPAGWDMKEYNGGMKFQNGDTLMARITPCLENGKVAYINFLEENEVAFGSTEYIVIASRGAIEPEVFYFLTRHTDFVDFAVKNMNGSSGRQRVSAETIGTYKLPVVSPEDMVILETIAKEALNKIKYNSLENIRLSEIRDTLLPKLMSGEFKINKIDC